MADPVRTCTREDRLTEHAESFQACYGRGGPPRLFFAPGRVNLFGGHLDYNGGPVMPTAIDRGTFLAVRPRSDRRIILGSTQDADGLEFDLESLPTTAQERWVDYPLGVLLDLAAWAKGSQTGGELCGLDVLYGGDLPLGAGLSSSASICVGTAYMLDKVWGLGLEVGQRVRSALSAERGFVGVQCGIMDPFAVGHAKPGHMLWLDCKDESYEHLPLDPDRLAVVVADTGVKRKLAATEFNRRVAQCRSALEKLALRAPGLSVLRDVTTELLAEHGHCLDPVEMRRAQHVVAEVERTFEARASLLTGDLKAMAAQMFQTHESLRTLYEVSCPELDCLVEAARGAPGALGSRLTGAGFGGCTVTLVERRATAEVCEVLTRRYDAAFGVTPTVQVFGGDPGPRELTL